MPNVSLRQFLKGNRFSVMSGVRHLLPGPAKGSLRYFLTNFVLYMDRLQPYQQLSVNDQLASDNGLLNLLMQSDGNLVLYRTQFGSALWASNTAGDPVSYAIMQADGNLVAYSVDGIPYWATGTGGHPGAIVVLQSDGNLVVYDSQNHALWASNTVQDFNSPTFLYTDASGYHYDETSERWKQLCTAFPCFALLQWPGYLTQVVDRIGGQPIMINGQAVVIQLWKGTCQQFLGLPYFPGGVGAEVGVYHRVPGRTRPTLQSLSLLPAEFAAFIIATIANLADDQLWWAVSEPYPQIQFTLTNTVTNQIFFTAGPENTYWLNKWMDDASYEKYRNDQKNQTPASPTDYWLDYSVNGERFPRW